MKKLLILLLSVLSLTAFAQQKKVAVYITGEQSGITQVLGDQLVAAFAKSGKYIAIERTLSFLSELKKEQRYQYETGEVDDSELSRLGKQFGVQLVCVAKISEVFGEKYISARLIDVESAEVTNTSNATSKLDNMQELLNVTEKLAKELTAKTVQEIAAEKAARQRANEETEKMLSEAFTKGYIKVDNIYAATSSSYVPWSQVPTIAAECRLGGWADWRVPTATELGLIQSTCRGYYEDRNDRDKYPNLSDSYLHKFFYIVRVNGIYWVKDGYIIYGDLTGYMKGNNANYRLLLVRDAK